MDDQNFQTNEAGIAVPKPEEASRPELPEVMELETDEARHFQGQLLKRIQFAMDMPGKDSVEKRNAAIHALTLAAASAMRLTYFSLTRKLPKTAIEDAATAAVAAMMEELERQAEQCLRDSSGGSSD